MCGLILGCRSSMSDDSKQEFVDRISNQINDYWGNYSHNIICLDEKYWLIKSKINNPREKYLTRLAFLLGKDWLNIPEVRFFVP